MASRSSVHRWLEGAGLQRFFPKFEQQGITEDKFVNLIVSDYHSLGVTELNDRQTLFKLIQLVKKKLEAQAPAPHLQLDASPEAGLSHPSRGSRVQSYSSSKTSSPARSVHAHLEQPHITTHTAHMPEQLIIPETDSVATESKQHDANLPYTHTYNNHTHNSNSSSSSSSNNNNNAQNQNKQRAGPKSRIMVCVRKRPLNDKEKAKGETDCAHTRGAHTFEVTEPRSKVDLTRYMCTHKFIFDAVFDEFMSNEEIYDKTCKPLVDFFFEGGNATCFAYGQTGSGKTYTMMGPEGGGLEQNGLYVLAARDIFYELRQHPELMINVSFFEIYGGKFFDLLNDRQRLDLREDKYGAVHCIGLREIPCSSWDQLIEMIQFGNTVRSSGVTGANTSSSRSHAILQIACNVKRNGKLHGKFSFIDLAGSERAADTQTNKQKTRLEGAEINKSLLALKECIRALDQNASHRPFRGSKLTQVLKESLIGNSRTIMIAAVSPSVASVEHTLNTLRYADRVKEMKEAGSSRKARHNAYMPHNDENNSSKRNSSHTSSSSRTTRPRSVSPRASKHHNRAVTSISFKNAQKTKSIKAPTSYRGHLRAPTATANLRSRTVKSPKHNRHRSAAPAKSGKSRSIPSIPRISPSDSPSRSFRKEKSFDGSTTSSNNNNNRNNDNNNNGNGNGLLKLLEKQKELKTQNKNAQTDILDQHRKHIHSTMMRVKQNMELLKSFEGKKMDVKEYLSSMRDLLSQAVQSANGLTSNVKKHERSLMEEGYVSLELERLKMNH